MLICIKCKNYKCTIILENKYQPQWLRMMWQVYSCAFLQLAGKHHLGVLTVHGTGEKCKK